jgi:hypothetical protein
MDTRKLADRYFDPDLFTRFAARCRVGRFIVLDIPGRKAPTACERFRTATNEEHTSVVDDERGCADLQLFVVDPPALGANVPRSAERWTAF